MLIAKLNGQKLTVASDTVVSDSVKYLTVRFEFSKEWDEYSKTALFFGGDGSVYSVPMIAGNSMYIGENICYVPYEVIKQSGFEISVFGTTDESVITSNKVSVQVTESGYSEGEAPRDPTPSEYQQLSEAANYALNEALLARQIALENTYNFQNQLNSKMDRFGTVYENDVVVEKNAYFNGGINIFENEARFEGTVSVLKTPENDIDAINKGYLDGLVGDIEAALDSIIALQNSYIGGEAE